MDLIVSLVTITCYSVYLTRRGKLNASVTPFVTLCGIMIFLTAAGICDLLVPGMILVYAAALAAAVFTLVKEKDQWKQILAGVFQPGFVFFLAVTAFFWFELKARNAGFRVWDEFSFWGIAARAVYERRKVYTLFTSSMINISYPPGLPLNSFFLQFLSPFFCEWKTYTAYNMLAMAAVTPLFSRVRWKNPLWILATGGICYFGIYEFFYGLDGLVAYANAYADWIVGFCFGGVLLVWYCCETSGTARYLASMIAVMALPLVRDIGLALGLVASGIMVIDLFLDGRFPFREKKGKVGILLRFVDAGLLMLSVVASYLMWTIHFNLTIHIDRVTIPYPYSALQMLKGEDPHALEVWAEMVKAFSSRQFMNFGTPREMVIVFTAVATVLFLIAKDKKNKLRIGAYAVLNLFGFFVYFLFHAYMYTAIFDYPSGMSLICYERYVSSYAFGWYFSLIGLAASSVAEPYELKKLPEILAQRWKILPGLCVVLLALFSVWHFLPFPMKTLSITSDYVDISPNELIQLAQKNQRRFRSILTEDARIYVVAQDSSGGEWFLCNYAFMPAYTVTTMGGGNFVSQEIMDASKDSIFYRYMVVANKENFAEFLRENDVDFLYIFSLNQYFMDEFAPMFNDGLMERIDGSVYLYAVHDMGDSMEFVGVYSGDQYLELKEAWGSN